MRRTHRHLATRVALTLACLASAAHAAPNLEPPAGDFASLRARLRWLPVKVGSRELPTLDAGSRLLLARSAAERAGLAEVGLDFRDVYGVIDAETSWVPRTGMGRNGVPSHGLAQFEPATARALGVRNANDPVEAVHAAATLLKEAAQWSARRISGLGLSGAERAARLREGVSIYYNLSSRARERWNGASTAGLPLETRRHIVNVRVGRQQAERLHRAAGGRVEQKSLLAQAAAAARAAPAQVRPAAASRSERRPVAASLGERRVVAVPARSAAPQPMGTIAWSGEGSDADGRRGGTHVVWSDGRVTRQGDGRVRWSSRAPG